MEEKHWDTLLQRVKDGRCTPFLGAGAAAGTLPLGADIAKEWAKELHHPLKEDAEDLARIAQFLAVRHDPMYPKERIRTSFDGHGPPDFDLPYEPHGVLADLPLSVYLTTNYDDFMMQALRSRGKEPERELCRWNDHPAVRRAPSPFSGPEGFEPTPARPIVYHLHGLLELPESLVLTEDDYIDFLVNVSRDLDSRIPPRIQEAVAEASLLFLGYQLRDLDFRVLYRGLVGLVNPSGKRFSFTVQMGPPTKPESKERVQEYLRDYFERMDVRVFWGTAHEFAAELRRRWTAFNEG